MQNDTNRTVWQGEDCRACLGWRSGDCNKGDFGYIALIGGSLQYGGAAKLANMAACAMRSGAGVVKLAVPRTIADAVTPYLLESTLAPLSDRNGELRFVPSEIAELIRNVRSVAIGMGCKMGNGVRKTLQYLLQNFRGTLVIDADGLNCIATRTELLKGCRPRVVVTPHVGEFSRLTGLAVEEIKSRPTEYAQRFASDYGVITLLKGASTTVTDGNKTYVIERGCAGMATAGSGDVLSGIVAALCAYNNDKLLEAVATAAYVNGLAGELAEAESNPISMTAGDTARHITAAISSLISRP